MRYKHSRTRLWYLFCMMYPVIKQQAAEASLKELRTAVSARRAQSDRMKSHVAKTHLWHLAYPS